MDITPKEIQEKRFSDAFRGYNHEDVDMFLDEVALSFERIYEENQKLRRRLKEIEDDLEKSQGTEGLLKRTLLSAQKTADEAIAEAKEKAEGLLSVSEQRAREILQEAQAKVDGLKRFEEEYKTRLRGYIESQRQVLDEGPVASPANEEVAISGAPPADEEVPLVDVPAPEPREQGQVSVEVAAEDLDEEQVVSNGPSEEQIPAKQGDPIEEDDRAVRKLFWGEDDS